MLVGSGIGTGAVVSPGSVSRVEFDRLDLRDLNLEHGMERLMTLPLEQH